MNLDELEDRDLSVKGVWVWMTPRYVSKEVLDTTYALDRPI